MNYAEIAKLAKVSTATVSRVLSRTPTVNPALAKRVWKLVCELGYYPNPQARALVLGRSRMFGLIVSEITNPFFPEIVQCFEDIAIRSHYEVLLGTINHDPGRTQQVIRRMLERRVDGVALLTFECDDSLIERFRVHNVPLTAIHVQPGPGVNTIEIDYEHGIRNAVQHLAALRHHRIAFISGPLHLPSAMARRDAVIKSMQEIGMAMPPEYMVRSDHKLEGGMNALMKLVSLPDPPTAVLCSNDVTAIGVLRQAYDIGMAIPQEMSVIGFDDITIAQFTIPPLTTVRMSQAELANLAFNALLDQADDRGDTSPNNRRLLMTDLVLRCSTALIRGA